MNETPTDLRFTLDDFNYQRANTMLTGRLFSGLQRQAVPIYAAFLGVLVAGSIVWDRFVGQTNLAFLAFLVVSACGALILNAAQMRKRMWAAVKQSPTYAGQMYVHLDRSGVTFGNDFCKTTVTWVPGIDVIAADGGALITLGAVIYLPISANAFDSTAARDAFLARAQTFVVPPDGIFS